MVVHFDMTFKVHFLFYFYFFITVQDTVLMILKPYPMVLISKNEITQVFSPHSEKIIFLKNNNHW